MALPLTSDIDVFFEHASEESRLAFDDVAQFLDTTNVDDASRQWLLTAGSEQSAVFSNRIVVLIVAVAAATTILLALAAGAAGSWLSVAMVPVPLVLATIAVGVRAERTSGSTSDGLEASDQFAATPIGPERPGTVWVA